MTAVLTGAFAAGLLGSPHCVGMCGGFATAATRPGSGAAWHGGRLAAYVALGALAGAFGAPFGTHSRVGAVLAAVLLVCFTARLAGLGPPVVVRIPGVVPAGRWLATRSGLPARAAFGALSALLPCGLLWSALALAAASGSPVVGTLALGLFWAATVPALAVAASGLRRIAAARPWTRRLIAAGVLGAGLWSIVARAQSGDAPSCHTHP